SGARAGDVLILGKPLGVGILSAALKKGVLGDAGYRQLIDTTTRLNSAGPELATLPGVHAMTDVTGFGLLGHLLGMCRGAGLGARVRLGQVPEIEGVREFMREGYVTGASARNWASYGDEVRLAPGLTPLDQALLCDPQTSGGLLVACAPEAVPAALEIFEREGFGLAAVIGEVREGAPLATVEA
ncbi:MAG TPA: selenide, water dikinase SelD, partial [Steroidobacteraceae bacterium]|nr:selenide, water dikinase SelD [Steroidobacteraceae bacterium]